MKGIEKCADELPGGVADGKEGFDTSAVLKGAKVELEHTSDLEKAIEIAEDHLAEDPEYYEKLEQMHTDKTAGRPPNYEMAEGERSCGNCGAYEEGYCKMFETQVDPEYVCDDWVSEEAYNEEAFSGA